MRAPCPLASPCPEKIKVALPRALHDVDVLLPLFAPSFVEGLSTNSELRPASHTRAATPWQALPTNNIDMSSTESSGAPAEASATTPAPAATFPTFGSTRGSGLARGKRPAASPAATAAAPTGYTPTAIEVINAPREYQNPFAPAETPAAASPEPVARVPAESAVPAPVAPVAPTPVVVAPAPVVESAPAVAAVAPAAPVQNEAPAELNILEPEQPKAVHAQTWESEGFRPARERSERPRRDERAPREERAPRSEQPAEPVDLASIPEKFLYVRPGYNYVPTPTNYGGAPRERSERPAHGSPERAMETSVAAEAPAKSGGFFGWLKALFGGSPAAPAATGTPSGEQRYEGGQRRHRGGRNRSGGQGGGEGGGQRRSRGGRGRGGERGGYRGERSGGGDAGPSAT